MKIFRDLTEFTPPPHPAVTIGTYDGIHAGHQKILSRLIKLARQQNGESVLLTFWPHPRLVLQPTNHDLKLINTMDEKIDLLRRAGLDNLLMVPFSKKFANISKDEFIEEILVNNLQTRSLIAGYDHRFGKNREGDFKDLENASGKYGFYLEEIPAQTVNDIAVSSTKIRNALAEGDIETANGYLKYPFFLTGQVEEGDRIGRDLGYPTANISIKEEYKLIPDNGVYVVLVKWQGQLLKGMLNIGYRPTVSGTKKMIEVNIFDFNQEIYGETLRIFLLHRIRDEVKFADLEELKTQLGQDKEKALHYFAKNSPEGGVVGL